MFDSTSTDKTAATTTDLKSKPASFPYYGEYDENGVDLSLLRYMLSLTPRERILRMEKFAQDTLKMMEYGRRHRESKLHSGG